MTNHNELAEIMQAQHPQKKRAVRKMISCPEEDYEKLVAIAKSLHAPITRTLSALISYYLEEDIKDA
jgi:hypothetical protein